jgi:hypothetical protein
MSWTSSKRRAITNLISDMDSYANNGVKLSAKIEQADGFLTNYLKNTTANSASLTQFEAIRNEIDGNLNTLKNTRIRLTKKLSDEESMSYKSKLTEIGTLQQDTKNAKETLKQLNDELNVAESREDAIKNRNTESSYAQTFGYIFRPFRRASYAVIVPLIFIIMCASVYIVWTAPTNIKFNIGIPSIVPKASAPPVNNFNKQMKELFK